MNKIDEILNDKNEPCYIRDTYKTEGERLYFLKEFGKMPEEEKNQYG